MLRNKQQDLSCYVKEQMLYISYSEKFIKYIEIKMIILQVQLWLLSYYRKHDDSGFVFFPGPACDNVVYKSSENAEHSSKHS